VTNGCCILCGSRELRREASLETSTIEREYRRVFGIEARCPGEELYLERCARCDLAFFTPQCPGDEVFYQGLQRFPWYYQDDKPEYRVAASHVGPEDSVLEIGGGEGAFASHLRCRSYQMLEMNRAAVAVARSNGLDAREGSVQSHAAEYPEAFDVVCAFQVLEHVPDPREFVAAGLACLRPGGRLIVSVPGDESFAGRHRHNLLNVPPHHMTRWTDLSLANLGASFGMEVAALYHDALAPWHTMPYASNLVDQTVASVLRRPWQPLDPLFVSLPLRTVRGLLRLLPYPAVRVIRARLRGHSTTVVYEKAGADAGEPSV
jgi:2-polyprenyl-3-methyl-5-hydroxy-6-metoxy-1,4-benzoquinol methylase